jgi:TM2 domain-containing membrane protein YozV
MEANQVEQLIALYGAKLPIISINVVRRKLVSMDYVTASMYLAQMKDPTITIILSIFLGGYGIDRIYIGDVGLGIVKLLTCGGIGVWWFVDLFLITDLVKEKNLQFIMNAFA